MRFLLLVIVLAVGVWVVACGGDGEPSGAGTPTEGAATREAGSVSTPVAADIDLDATLFGPADLPEGWQFQGAEDCGGTAAYTSLCPAQGVVRGKVALATRQPGENISAVVVVAEPGQAETVAQAMISRAFTGERPWDRETVDAPVTGAVRLVQELTDGSPPRVVQRIIFSQDPVAVDVSVSVLEPSEDVAVDELAALIQERIAGQLP
jgi:hypothetical protein